jgi:hypothetical protein
LCLSMERMRFTSSSESSTLCVLGLPIGLPFISGMNEGKTTAYLSKHQHVITLVALDFLGFLGFLGLRGGGEKGLPWCAIAEKRAILSGSLAHVTAPGALR